MNKTYQTIWKRAAQFFWTLSIATSGMAAIPQTAQAQQEWTIDSCMLYAIKHAAEVKREVISTRQRVQDYHKSITDFLPSVSASVSGQYAWGRNIDPETNTYNNVTTFNNYYQIYADLTVFDGFSNINAWKQAKLAKRYSKTAMQKIQDDKAIDVMQKFVDAAYAEASIQIASDKLNESKRLLAKTLRLFELGEKARPDVVQMESQVAEDEYNLIHQQNTAKQNLLTLKTAMNYPEEKALKVSVKAITENLTYTSKQGTLPEHTEDIYAHFSMASPDIKTAEYEVEKAHYDYKIAKGQMLPTLTLSGALTTNFYRNLSQKGQYESFSSQFKNNRGEYLSLTLSIPLYNADNIHSVKKARNDWQLAQINLEDERRKLHDNIALAIMDAEGYAKELSQMEKKVASDSLAYHISSRKFEEGMLSTFDLHTAAQTLLESRIKMLQMQMMLVIKQRLVDYYKGDSLIHIP